MADETKVRVGVVGVGYLGQHHARLYKALEETELVGICDADPARAQEIGKAQDCPVFDSLHALAEQCDALSIAVPTDRHYTVAKPLLEAGKHLLIEKPLCATLEEADALVQAAQNSGSIVQVGHIEHYNPVMGFLEEAVASPRFITADRLAPFNPRGTEVGVVLDLMIHDLGVILALVKSPVERIEAVGVSVLSNSEDIANVRVVFESGCVANINTSRVSLKKVREIRVFQPNTYLSLNFMEQKGHLLRKEGSALNKQDISLDREESLRAELQSFAQCVRSGTAPKVDIAFGRRVLEVAMEVTRQIREQMSALV